MLEDGPPAPGREPGRPCNPGTPLREGWFAGVQVNLGAAERRVAGLAARRPVDETFEAAWLVKALTCVDLTTLAGDDTPDRVRRLCATARRPLDDRAVAALGLEHAPPTVAAVCVYPTLVRPAVAALRGSGIPVASVATGFPAGLTPLPQRLAEIRHAVGEGAAEIDIVITRAHALRGEWAALHDEVAAMRDACGTAHMKAILGTGDLRTLRTVYQAAAVAMQAGADFIKTSTGKEEVNATLPVSLTMLRALRDHGERTGARIGFKPAGGLRTAEDALDWLALVKEELGRPWLEPDLFRIGASTLLADIARRIARWAASRGDGSAAPRVGAILATLDRGPAPEATDAARAWLAAHPDGFGHFIDGAFTPPGDAAVAIHDPATGDPLAAVARGSARDVDAAVVAAARAAAGWSATPGPLRAERLRALARLVEDRGRFLAVLETLETGAPVRQTRDVGVPRAAERFRHHAGSAELAEAGLSGPAPAGVCGLVMSRDTPLSALARHVAPALAAGDALVLKPAAGAPLTALAFAELCREAGLPRGVVNVVCGDADVGSALVRQAGVASIAFMGSAAVARSICEAAAVSGQALALDAGGPSPFVVFADADLDAAVEGAVEAVWCGGGPERRAGCRILVQEAVAERFVARLGRRMAGLRVGDPLDGSTDVGPVAGPGRLRRLQAVVARALADGATLVQPAADMPAGRFFPPTLLVGVDPGPATAGRDIPGPVAALTTFRTPDEALALAADAPPGPSASIWSGNVDLALGAAARLRSRTIFINAADLSDDVTESLGADVARDFGPAAGRGGGPVDGGPHAPGAAPGHARRGGTGAVRGAVAAASRAVAWGAAPPRDRGRALQAVADALASRADEFGVPLAREVEASVRRTSFYAAWADRFDGRVRATRPRLVALTTREPFGVVGLVCPDGAPLLALVSLLMPVLAMGNRAVVVPSPAHPQAALELRRALDAGGIPAGTVGFVAGGREAAVALAEHGDVGCLWNAGPPDDAAVERAAAGDLKPIWTIDGRARDWFDPEVGQGPDYLRRATWAKTVWVPYGE